MHYLHLSFLGSFSVNLAGQTLPDVGTDKVRALLVYLVLEPERDHARRQLAALLWPEVSDKQARQSLRDALYRLRLSLDRLGAALTPPISVSDELLVVSHQTVRLRTNGPLLKTVVDVTQIRSHLSTVESHPHTNLIECNHCLAALEEATSLYRGELLAGFGLADAPEFEEWLLLQREMLFQQALLAFDRLAAIHEARGDFSQATTFGTRLLTLDPYRETSYRRVMRLLALRGLPDRALSQFAACRQLMMEEFGAEPDGETLALAEQIRRGELLPPPLPKTELETVSSSSDLRLPPQVGDGRGDISRHDWYEMPTGSPFFGRAAEQNELKERLVEERCRIVAILSSGGMGKTSLAAEVVPTIADHFDRVIWRSLLNAPPLGELLETLQPAVAAHELGGAPKNVAQQLQVLFYALREQRVLLVLDNLESILQADAPGYYRTGYTDYEQLLHGMATRQHRGQLLLTSREQPSHLRQLERDMAHVRMLQLQGLDEVAGEELLVSRGLTGGTGNEAALTTRYSGNPLALKLVADAVQDLFLGDVQEFLGEEALVFDDIRTVLEQQFARATDIEQEILLWLAVEREPLTVAEIHHRLLDSPPRRMVLEALRNLQRRSLTERTETGFGLQNVITEFLTDRLVEEAIHELSSKKLAWLRHHALLNAGAKEYVRESQVRLLLRPIAKHIHAKGPSHHLQNQIRHLLDELRNEESNRPGYAAGNLLNLLIHSARLDGEEELSAYDFSDLAIKQAFLRGATLHGFNFSGAQFADTVFTETFGAVLCLAVQPHGNLMAAGTFLGPIYLWRTDNLSSVAVIPWHQELVLGITFSTDGTKLASACADGTVGIWELSTIIDKDGAPLSNAPVSPSQTLKGHKGWVQAVAFSPNGQTIASGGVDQTVRLWDSSTGQQRHQFRKGAGRIYSVSFSPDGATLACGSEDRKIHLWDVQSGTEQSALTYETESSAGTFGVHAICFSPNGQILASCSPENTIWLWQLPLRPGGRAKASQICRGHSDWISDIAFNPDGDTLASASFDGTVRLWNVATGEASMVLFGHTNQPNAVAFTADGHSLVSGGADETIRFWDITSGHSNRILQGHTNHSADVAFSPDGEVFATANADNVVRLWECNLPGNNHLTDEAEFPAQRVLRGHKDNVLAVRFHPNGQLLASGGHDHTIYLWDRQTARPIRKLLGHSNCVRALAFSPNGETLVSGSYDLTARLWDVESGMVQHILHGHKDWILSVAISPDGELLATASDTVRLWDMASGNLVHTIPSQASMVYDVTFSPDGKMLVAGYLNQAVCVWDVASGKMLDDLYGHTGFVNFVAFSPDGQTLLSGDAGHWLYLWQADSQNQPQPLPHISISAIKYAFSPDSQLLVTGGDETIKIWQMPTGECIKTLHIPGPYERMDIRGATGLTEAQKATLKALGAIEGQ